MFSNKAAVLVTALALIGCGQKPDAKQSEGKPAAPVPVQTTTVTQTELPQLREFTGTVKAKTSVAIASKVMGYVKQVTAQAGTHVSAGQVLVTLEARELDSGVQQAEAGQSEARQALTETDEVIRGAESQMQLAKTTHRRMKDLFEKRSVSNQEYDEAAGYEPPKPRLPGREAVEAK